jgi:transcriptional regulator with XRE-family HTH domain
MLAKLKQDVGDRFRAFRLNQKKAQHVLASELKVHQSTITNIEHGTTFPKINYLHYFYEKYGLNVNWLVTGEGEMYLENFKKGSGAAVLKYPHVRYGDPNYDQYAELINLMQVPVIEQLIMARLSEVKMVFKDEVEKFEAAKEKELREKKKKSAKARVKR